MVTDAEIKAIFLAAGFTVKPGHDDLKPYVYEAARELIDYTKRKAIDVCEGMERRYADARNRWEDGAYDAAITLAVKINAEV
jgi:hypothetical protein